MSERNPHNLAQSLERLMPKVPCGQQARVTSVDEAAGLCDVLVLAWDVTVPDVLLRASADGQGLGLLPIPEVGSTIIVVPIDPDGNRWAAVGWSTLSKIIFNGGSLGGLAVVESVAAQLRRLEEAHNALASAFNAHIHPTPSGPSSPPSGTPQNQISPLTQAEDIENPDILQ